MNIIKKIDVNVKTPDIKITANISKKDSSIADDYNQLKNLPSINDIELKGNLSAKDLNIETSQLINDGDGASPFVTEDKIKDKLLNNIKDDKNKSLIGNDIQTNVIRTDGYIDSQGVWQEISETPILVSDINANIELDGYYVIPKSLIENGAFGYSLYQFLEGAIGTPIKNYIGKISTSVSRWLTNTYNYNSANMNAFGSNNLVSGDRSLVVGNNNKNAGYNSLISGKNNTSNAGESIVSGLNNTNLGGSSAVFGVNNNVNDNQGLATGYHNKISTGSLYSAVTGIGNVTKGLANFIAGDYNYTGSDYNVAIGSQNIVGGNITYNDIPITEIQNYSSSSQYLIGSIVKLNGYVYKALVDNPSRPELTSNEWQIVKPVTTKDNSINSFSGGSKNTINSSNSFAYGTGLIANKGNQTVLGKYNDTNINASLIIGNGTDNDSRTNIFEVLNNGQINTKDRINMSAGSKTAVLRNTTSGDFVISGEGGVAIRPSGTGVTAGSIIFRPSFVGAQSRNVDLGSASVPFRNLYLQNNLMLNNKTYSNENFVSNEDRTNWDNKANSSYVDEKINNINSKIPTEYLKDASVTNNTLTITKQDNTQVTFQGEQDISNKVDSKLSKEFTKEDGTKYTNYSQVINNLESETKGIQLIYSNNINPDTELENGVGSLSVLQMSGDDNPYFVLLNQKIFDNNTDSLTQVYVTNDSFNISISDTNNSDTTKYQMAVINTNNEGISNYLIGENKSNSINQTTNNIQLNFTVGDETSEVLINEKEININTPVLTPNTDNLVDLGKTSNKYKDLYLAGKLSDGTNEITISQINTLSKLYTHNLKLGVKLYDDSRILVGDAWFLATIISKDSEEYTITTETDTFPYQKFSYGILSQSTTINNKIYISGNLQYGGLINGYKLSTNLYDTTGEEVMINCAITDITDRVQIID